MVQQQVDLSQINKLMNTSIEQENVAINAKGVLNLIVNFNSDVTDINSPVEIQLPEVNANNSFNYLDLLEEARISEEPVPAVLVTPVTNPYTVEAGLLSPLSTENVKEVYTAKAGDTLGKISAQI